VLDLVLPLATLLPHSIGPYIALVLIGFGVGILGHLSSSRALVLAGIILIALGAFLFPVVLNLTTETPPQVEKSPPP
jgi:drug/metabolite transporter (DMT)-like permease